VPEGDLSVAAGEHGQPGGGVLAVTLQTASPGSFDLVLSLTLLSASVIGGLGSLTGAVWGSISVVYLNHFISDNVDGLGFSTELADKLNSNLAAAVYGLLLIVVMRTMPGGIQSQVRKIPGLLHVRPRDHATQPTGGSSCHHSRAEVASERRRRSPPSRR
jgi:branched-chain amino acid transport system permease protein